MIDTAVAHCPRCGVAIRSELTTLCAFCVGEIERAYENPGPLQRMWTWIWEKLLK